MLLDFSIKTLEYSYTIDDDASAGIHCLNQIVEEIEESEKVYDSKDFILNKDYGDSLGFVLKKRYENRFAYIYFAHRDGIVWRIAYNTHIDNPAEISFGNLKDKGVNAISDGILSVENSNFDDKSGLISLNIKVSEDKNGNYSTQIYRGK
ncbi:MAG: hypothetical protein Q4P34_02135 [Tissierellia bacterium]|nr:hypothetical protein [Tissierellia bacterium]